MTMTDEERLQLWAALVRLRVEQSRQARKIRALEGLVVTLALLLTVVAVVLLLHTPVLGSAP